MKILAFCLLFGLGQCCLAQNDSINYQRKIQKNTNNDKLQFQLIADMQAQLDAQLRGIDLITNVADINNANIEILSDSLHIRVLDAHSNAHDAHAKIDAIDSIVAQNKLFWLTGSALFFILLAVFYYLLRRKLMSVKQYSKNRRIKIETDLKKEAVRLEQQLIHTNKDIAASNVRLEVNATEIGRMSDELLHSKTELALTKKAMEALSAQLEAIQQQLKQ
jgi:alkyl hydroperoxide reductase subunit AhpC